LNVPVSGLYLIAATPAEVIEEVIDAVAERSAEGERKARRRPIGRSASGPRATLSMQVRPQASCNTVHLDIGVTRIRWRG
jgi:hypothetical protein